MTTATVRAGELLTRAALSEEDLGYPDGVAFLAVDVEEWRDLLWNNVVEGKPTVLVDEDANEMLFAPMPRPLPLQLLDQLRGKRMVAVGWRSNLHHYDVQALLDRETVARLDGPSRTVLASAR